MYVPLLRPVLSYRGLLVEKSLMEEYKAYFSKFNVWFTQDIHKPGGGVIMSMQTCHSTVKDMPLDNSGNVAAWTKYKPGPTSSNLHMMLH